VRRIRWYAARLAAMSLPEVAGRATGVLQRLRRRLVRPRPFAAQALLEGAWGRAVAGPLRPIRFFGTEIDFPRERPEWSRDYHSGQRAPLRFYGDVDYRDHGVVGDSKHTWELNRHQFIVPWAIDAAETGDETAAAAVVAVVLDWIASNPR
jgi:hypothetical protein